MDVCVGWITMKGVTLLHDTAYRVTRVTVNSSVAVVVMVMAAAMVMAARSVC